MFLGTMMMAIMAPAPGTTIASTEGHGQEIRAEAADGLTNKSLFSAGSIAKYACTVAILKQVDAGKLDLEATLDQLIPEFKNPDANKIKLWHVLGVRSGIPADGKAIVPPDQSRPPSNSPAIVAANAITEGPTKFVPGSQWSNDFVNWIVAQAVLESVIDEPVEDYLQRVILDAADMKDSDLLTRQPNVVPPADELLTLPQWAVCGGGLVTTPTDLIKLLRHVHLGGLKEETRNWLFDVKTPEQNYTIGTRARFIDGDWWSWQSGSFGDHKSFAIYNLATGEAYATMTASGDPNVIRRGMLEWLGDHVDTPAPRMPNQ